MKQLIQNFKTGKLYVDELAEPSVTKGMVLVGNAYSLISAGTEKGTVGVAQASLLGKATMRPDLVKQVIQNFRKEGFKATFDKVSTKLDSLKALGYSTSGTVLASLDTNGKYKVGDRVACAGQDFASHAEVVSIPQNLIAKIPNEVSFEEAAFTTVGAIALQGVRQANPNLGEYVCVIGLGLIGQITCQLLKANGCKVFGIDVSSNAVNLTNSLGFAVGMERNDQNLMSAALNFTKGYGFDKVIITAAAPTNDPIVVATELLRRKGIIIIVGAVSMDIPREPHFYKKELELKISCSYGPGRYDTSYEEEGHDYPIAYVRWTEQRNMEAFLGLIADGVLNMKPLISHIFDIEEAEQAYNLVLGKTKEPFIGILLKYKRDISERKSIIPLQLSTIKSVNVGFIGAGSFAQSYLIPHVKLKGSLDTVVTRTGINSKSVGQKFSFAKSSTNTDHVIENIEINALFIATQHDSHAKYVLEGIDKGKSIFVEKPLALNIQELENIVSAYTQSDQKQLLVGFNRRFAPISVQSKKSFKGINEPLIMNFRINAGYIPKEHWTQTEVGGGRIIGELCHWIDLMQFYCDAEPIKVYSDCVNTDNIKIKSDDNLSILIKFSDGSLGNIAYVANGDKGLAKERIEVSGGNISFVNDDFRKGHLYNGNKVTEIKNQGKGHKEEVIAFMDSIKNGEKSPISFRSQILTTLTTFKIIESINTGLPQEIFFEN